MTNVISKRRMREFEIELRRETAYHEAGHAAIQWMFGDIWNLHFIDMRGNERNSAFVRTVGPNIAILLRSEGAPSVVKGFKELAQSRILQDLAGYAAEARLTKAEDWFEDEWDSYEWELHEGHDFNRAWEVAKAGWGDNGNAWRVLCRMAVWVDEALDHPRLWAATEALAERLVTAKRRMSGDQVMRILEKAWGEELLLPYREMGPQWRRRFAHMIWFAP